MWPLQELLLCTTETCQNQDLKTNTSKTTLFFDIGINNVLSI